MLEVVVGLLKMPLGAWDELVASSLFFVFTHLSDTANVKWELFVNKLLSDIYVCVCVCVCVTYGVN